MFRPTRADRRRVFSKLSDGPEGGAGGSTDSEGRGVQGPSRRGVSRFAMSRRRRSECIRGRRAAT